MPADIIEIRPPTDTRPQHDRAFQGAIAALLALVEARDGAVAALDQLAEAFVVYDVETYEETLALPFGEILERHSSATIALWQHIGFMKANLDDPDVFDVLKRLDMPELEETFAAWKRANGLEEVDNDVC